MGVRQTKFYKREQMFNQKTKEVKINDKEGREYNDN